MKKAAAKKVRKSKVDTILEQMNAEQPEEAATIMESYRDCTAGLNHSFELMQKAQDADGDFSEAYERFWENLAVLIRLGALSNRVLFGKPFAQTFAEVIYVSADMPSLESAYQDYVRSYEEFTERMGEERGAA